MADRINLSTDLFKITAADGSPINGGTGMWLLPTNDGPGGWMPRLKPHPCRSGYHVCRLEDLLKWVQGDDPVVWRVEVDGEVIDHGDKLVAERARLLEATPLAGDAVWRLLASDFAAHIHQHFHRVRPDDSRVADAIRVARMNARGEATDAARSAALTAGAAAGAAGRSAALAAGAAARSAALAAGAAAGAAGWAAGWAAREAGWAAPDAERAWQTRLLRDVITGRRQPGRVRITKWREAPDAD